MAGNEWLELLKSAEKIALVGSDTRKIHYKFYDGREMVEEYNLETGVLSRRAWKKNNILKSNKWDVEVGEPIYETPEESANIGLFESKNTPSVIHRVTKTKLEWRIRNFKYSNPTDYSVLLDANEKCITVRTNDKKFFKKLPILELQRLNLIPLESSLHHSRLLNNLIIQYDKPAELVSFEKKLEAILKNVRIVDNADLNCNPS